MTVRVGGPQHIVTDTNILLLLVGLDWGAQNRVPWDDLLPIMERSAFFPGNLALKLTGEALASVHGYLIRSNMALIVNSFVLAECKIHTWGKEHPIGAHNGLTILRAWRKEGRVAEFGTTLETVLEYEIQSCVLNQIGFTDVSLLGAAAELGCRLMTEDEMLLNHASARNLRVLRILDIPDI